MSSAQLQLFPVGVFCAFPPVGQRLVIYVHDSPSSVRMACALWPRAFLFVCICGGTPINHADAHTICDVEGSEYYTARCVGQPDLLAAAIRRQRAQVERRAWHFRDSGSRVRNVIKLKGWPSSRQEFSAGQLYPTARAISYTYPCRERCNLIYL